MRTSKLSDIDLSRIKAFYESEFHSTLTKLEHIKQILKKLKEVDTDVDSEPENQTLKNKVKTGAKRGRKPKILKQDSASAKKDLKGVVKEKSKISSGKNKKNKNVKQADWIKKVTVPDIKKSSSPRSYIHWSKIITKVISDNKKPMFLKEIVEQCIAKKKIKKPEELKRAKFSIQNLVYHLRDNNAINVYHPRGQKYQAYGMSGWFKNGVLNDKYKK